LIWAEERLRQAKLMLRYHAHEHWTDYR